MFKPEDPKLIAVPLMAPSSGAAIVSLQLIAAPATSGAQSDSLSLVEERLNSLGVEYIKEHVVEGGIKITQMFFHDPDANMIEVASFTYTTPPASCTIDHLGLNRVGTSLMG